MPDPGTWTVDTPTVAVHQGKLWLFVRGDNHIIWKMSWDGTRWGKSTQTSLVSQSCPVMASHNGSLEGLCRGLLTATGEISAGAEIKGAGRK